MKNKSMQQLLAEAQKGGYAVGAFNIHTMEVAQAIIAAAEAERAPVILQINQGTIQYAGIEYITAIAKTAQSLASVPVIVHLDHGTSYEMMAACIRHGFDSIMIDASKLPLAENIALVRKVVELAHPAGVAVEAELGKVGGVEDDIVVSEEEAGLTDPDEAVQFVQETGVDSLAVAIGTAHGVYKGVPRLDFERLEEIRKRVPIPLVLHGASGVPDEAVREAVARGICKVNISTELKQPFAATLRKTAVENLDEIDPRKLLEPTKEAMSEVVRAKIRLCGCAGKA